jgi:hypothetical protein
VDVVVLLIIVVVVVVVVGVVVVVVVIVVVVVVVFMVVVVVVGIGLTRIMVQEEVPMVGSSQNTLRLYFPPSGGLHVTFP